ncbi:MAG TPA: extracellular solute-binding protein [candidate division Zixibacteria bacterium]|nr:extracellular solute-binding protein [candidate division Zixibacteria bacterium]
MRYSLLLVLSIFAAASPAVGQGRPVADLANYRGADREAFLKAGARKEGRLTWYTTLTAHRDIASVFEAKYPGIKVETYRTGSTDLLRRILSEAQSGRNLADVIETTPPTLMVMRDNKLLLPYFSPHLGAFPADAREDVGDKVLWTTDRESLIGLGYNRNLLQPADAPQSFDDLVKPQYRGRVAVSGDSTGVRMLGAMLRVKGEEYLKRLRALDIKMHMISGGAMHELLAAGEMPLSISIFRNHVLAARPKGAPTEWVPLDLVVSNAGGVALPAASNNPYGALLFIDFLLSPEGQKIFEERFRFATSTRDYGFKRWYPEKGLTAEQYEKSHDRWQKLLRGLTRK